MVSRRMVLAAAAALSLAAAPPATAAALTYDISFSAAGFLIGGSVSAPVDPVTGEFTVTFDPADAYFNETAGVVTDNLNIALGSPPAFTYSPEDAEFLLGGLVPGAGLIDSSKPNDDFSLDVSQFNGEPVIESFLYLQKTSGTTVFRASSSAISVAIVIGPVGAAIPEPTTWVLLIAGFAGIGVLGHRRAGRARAA